MIFKLLIPGLWLVWAVYWYADRRDAKAVTRQESFGSRLTYVVPLMAAGLLLSLPHLWQGWLSVRFLPKDQATGWASVAIVAAGLGFSVLARRHLGGNWSGTVTIKKDHTLIRTGPYRFVRHPIYSGLLLAFAGLAVFVGEVRGLIAIPFVALSFFIKLRLEERWMIEIFGDAYRRYRNEVKALIPFVL